MLKRLFIYSALVFLTGILLTSTGILKLDFSRLPKLNLSFPQVPKKQEEKIKLNEGKETIKLLNEESVIIEAVEKVGPSVVTIGIVGSKQLLNQSDFGFFGPFGFTPQPNLKQQKKEQDIGTGFVLTSDGILVTNKHVVSETDVKYVVITKDDKRLDVQKIYRDPSNDLAILKVSPSGANLKPIELGDSDKLKVGQLAIAIGTALGEFRNTVTTGVISGLGRGITAGDPFGGFQERLDNLIQTNAAINPGNSGGPLLNSSGQVIGVNVAVSGEGQNIGFALPINLVKDVVKNFNETGKFSRPYLGVRYTQITREGALLNDVPEGAYVRDVVMDSPAEKAAVKADDIITKIDGVAVIEKNGGLAKIIGQKKVGDRVVLTIYREEKEITISVTLGEFSG